MFCPCRTGFWHSNSIYTTIWIMNIFRITLCKCTQFSLSVPNGLCVCLCERCVSDTLPLHYMILFDFMWWDRTQKIANRFLIRLIFCRWWQKWRKDWDEAREMTRLTSYLYMLDLLFVFWLSESTEKDDTIFILYFIAYLMCNLINGNILFRFVLIYRCELRAYCCWKESHWNPEASVVHRCRH